MYNIMKYTICLMMIVFCVSVECRPSISNSDHSERLACRVKISRRSLNVWDNIKTITSKTVDGVSHVVETVAEKTKEQYHIAKDKLRGLDIEEYKNKIREMAGSVTDTVGEVSESARNKVVNDIVPAVWEKIKGIATDKNQAIELLKVILDALPGGSLKSKIFKIVMKKIVDTYFKD